MDGDAGGYFLYILGVILILLLLFSCYFASAEIAYASVNKIKIKTLSDNGNRKANKALYIINNFDKALICILIGNNLMHITCASIATLISAKLWGNGYITLTTLVVTVVVFLIGEMLPKSYAKANCENVSLMYAGSLKILMIIFTPLILFFTSISKLISKLFSKNEQPTVTEEELQDIIETMDEQGSFENEETGDIVQNALDFDDVTAQNILTSRVDMLSIDVTLPADEILKLIKEVKYSRIPVYENDTDNIVGIMRVRRFLKEYIINGTADIKKIMSKPYFVPGSTKIDDLFEKMTYNKCYMAVVTDEYGGTLGIVTIEDIVEEIVGEIWDEDDEKIESFEKTAENTYRVLADADVDDFFEYIERDLPDEELEHVNFSSWCCKMLETMPSEGTEFYYEPLNIVIEKIDHNRIISLIVTVDEIQEGEDE